MSDPDIEIYSSQFIENLETINTLEHHNSFTGITTTFKLNGELISEEAVKQLHKEQQTSEPYWSLKAWELQHTP